VVEEVVVWCVVVVVVVAHATASLHMPMDATTHTQCFTRVCSPMHEVCGGGFGFDMHEVCVGQMVKSDKEKWEAKKAKKAKKDKAKAKKAEQEAKDANAIKDVDDEETTAGEAQSAPTTPTGIVEGEGDDDDDKEEGATPAKRKAGTVLTKAEMKKPKADDGDETDTDEVKELKRKLAVLEKKDVVVEMKKERKKEKKNVVPLKTDGIKPNKDAEWDDEGCPGTAHYPTHYHCSTGCQHMSLILPSVSCCRWALLGFDGGILRLQQVEGLLSAP
jgi:hypothetical protein